MQLLSYSLLWEKRVKVFIEKTIAVLKACIALLELIRKLID